MIPVAHCGERCPPSGGGWYCCSLPVGHSGAHAAHQNHDLTIPAGFTWPKPDTSAIKPTPARVEALATFLLDGSSIDYARATAQKIAAVALRWLAENPEAPAKPPQTVDANIVLDGIEEALDGKDVGDCLSTRMNEARRRVLALVHERNNLQLERGELSRSFGLMDRSWRELATALGAGDQGAALAKIRRLQAAEKRDPSGLPAFVPGLDKRCDVRDPYGFICTREPDHKVPHVAHQTSGKVLAVWRHDSKPTADLRRLILAYREAHQIRRDDRVRYGKTDLILDDATKAARKALFAAVKE